MGEDAEIGGRMVGHGVRHVFLEEGAFGTSSKGYPVLLKGHDQLVKTLLPLHPAFYLSGKQAKHAKSFLAHLHKNQPKPGEEEAKAMLHEEVPYEPLQPYRDHLSSSTYTVF